MGSVLVLAERGTDDGTVRRSTCELLTVARRSASDGALCGRADEACVAALGCMARRGCSRGRAGRATELRRSGGGGGARRDRPPGAADAC